MGSVQISVRQGSSLVATAVVAAAMLVTAARTVSARTIAVSATTCTRDTPAVIHGEHKCLGAGEYCKSAYKREYLRYGYECVGSPPRLRRHRQ